MTFLADFPAPTKDEAWPVLITIFAILGIVAKVMEIWKHSRGTRVHGTIQSETVPQHAEQSDLDALITTVNQMRVESVEQFTAVREENTAQFREAQRSGENRVMAITQDVNTKVDGLSNKVGDLMGLITKALIDNGTQSEAINNIKATLNKSDRDMIEIRRRIDELISSGRSKRTSS